MIDQQHPITPPPEVEQRLVDGPGTWREKIVNAYRAGADAELEACCEYITDHGKWFVTPQFRLAELRAARRPKPPNLAEEGLRVLVEKSRTFGGRVEFDIEDVVTIRAALKRLQEMENQ